MTTLDTTIDLDLPHLGLVIEDVPCVVEYQLIGSYSPAFGLNPPEQPDLVIDEVRLKLHGTEQIVDYDLLPKSAQRAIEEAATRDSYERKQYDDDEYADSIRNDR